MNLCHDNLHQVESGMTPDDVIQRLVSVQHQQDAFYVLDVDDIIRKYEKWVQTVPRITPFYAVKCNDHTVVLQTLASLGAGFDCASQHEIAKVLECTGAMAGRIIYSMPIKQESDIRYAASMGVVTTTFDSQEELYKIKELQPDARLLLRFRSDAKVVSSNLGCKFGAHPKSAARLMRVARQLNLNLVGVGFHVGSGCGEPGAFDRAIRIARELVDLAAQEEFGYTLTLVDIGGGFSDDTSNGGGLDVLANVINTALDRYFPPGCGVDIVAEPGRYFVSSVFTLATRIFGRRLLTDEVERNEGISCYYYINDGTYGSFLDTLVLRNMHYNPRLMDVTNRRRNEPEVVCNIYGPTCDGVDCIMRLARGLPLMNIGDWLIFPDMGAYTTALSTTFNGFPVSKVLSIIRPDGWRKLHGKKPFDQSDPTPEVPCSIAKVPSINTSYDSGSVNVRH